MNSEPQSLIEAEKRQPTLFELPAKYREALEGLKEGKRTAGEFTGERLFEREPEKYQAVVAALAEGIGYHRIARAFGVSVNTVRGIAARERGPVDTEKKAISLRLREFARLASDRLVDEVDLIPVDKLGIVLGIALDKVQLLDGEATAIVGQSGDRLKVDAFNRLIESLPQTGFGAGEKDQTREAATGPAALPASGSGLVLEAELVPGTDGESVVSRLEVPN